ncbi:MAG: GNAT family N-acetyltransferase [Candidatus Zixiibacteriota bacterium]
MAIVEITRDNIESYRPALVRLVLAHMHVLGTETSKSRVEHTIDIVLEEDSRAHFIASVDEECSDVTGFCFFNTAIGLESGGRYLWLNEIHIKSDCRNRGIGRSMLAYMIEWAKENGYIAIYGITHRKNIGAQEFFDANDFVQTEVIWLDRRIEQ